MKQFGDFRQRFFDVLVLVQDSRDAERTKRRASVTPRIAGDQNVGPAEIAGPSTRGVFEDIGPVDVLALPQF
jgi:hypothetical protein